MKSIKIIALLSLFILISFQSCKKDHGVAPDIPPESSFVTDFSDFDDSKNLAEMTAVNWGHSAFNVAVWNVIITIGLVVPVASYVEALRNHEAVYQSDNTWLWEYSFDVGSSSFTAKLYGTIKTGYIDWSMYISQAGVYEDFLWYSGTSMLDGSSVDWILYDNPTGQNELLSIEWFKSSETTGNITYTNIVPGGNENGGYIKYGNDSETDLNAYYLIYNKGLDNLTQIEWSQTNQNGRVKDEHRFGDTNWHCWDTNYQDIDCQ